MDKSLLQKCKPRFSNLDICSSTDKGCLVYCIKQNIDRKKLEDRSGALFNGKRERSYWNKNMDLFRYDKINFIISIQVKSPNQEEIPSLLMKEAD